MSLIADAGRRAVQRAYCPPTGLTPLTVFGIFSAHRFLLGRSM